MHPKTCTWVPRTYSPLDAYLARYQGCKEQLWHTLYGKGMYRLFEHSPFQPLVAVELACLHAASLQCLRNGADYRSSDWSPEKY